MKEIRRTLKWTQAEFATHLGVTRDVVASWENGRVEPPEAVVRLVCREFAVHYEWLKYGNEPINIPADDLTVNRIEKLMNGDCDFAKAFIREMADLPPEGWERIASLVDRLYAARHPQA